MALKKIFTTRVRGILILAAAAAILTALAVLIASGGTTVGRNAVNVLLTPLRSGTAALTRQAERIYGYLFEYDQLAAENEGFTGDPSSDPHLLNLFGSFQYNHDSARALY